MKRGGTDFFVCDDCKAFSELVSVVFDDVHVQMERAGSIDPDTHPILRLLADSSFITSKNPRTAIFYKISDYLISRAFAGVTEISEEDLNRYVVTTRGWGDAFKTFEELNLVRIRVEQYRRVLILTDKTRKFAAQYLTAEKLSDVGLRTRLARIYVILEIGENLMKNPVVKDLETKQKNFSDVHRTQSINHKGSIVTAILRTGM
jgi:hypothetical protein